MLNAYALSHTIRRNAKRLPANLTRALIGLFVYA